MIKSSCGSVCNLKFYNDNNQETEKSHLHFFPISVQTDGVLFGFRLFPPGAEICHLYVIYCCSFQMINVEKMRGFDGYK